MKEVTDEVNDLKRRLCHSSTIPFRALDNIIYCEDDKLH